MAFNFSDRSVSTVTYMNQFCAASWSRTEDKPYTRDLFPFAVQSFFDPLSRFGRKILRDRFRHFIRMLMRRVTQEGDLPPVAATPRAEQKMSAQTEPLGQRKSVVKPL